MLNIGGQSSFIQRRLSQQAHNLPGKSLYQRIFDICLNTELFCPTLSLFPQPLKQLKPKIFHLSSAFNRISQTHKSPKLMFQG